MKVYRTILRLKIYNYCEHDKGRLHHKRNTLAEWRFLLETGAEGLAQTGSESSGRINGRLDERNSISDARGLGQKVKDLRDPGEASGNAIATQYKIHKSFTAVIPIFGVAAFFCIKNQYNNIQL